MARPGKTVLVERGGICNALSGPVTRYVNGTNIGAPAANTANVGGGCFLLEPDDYVGTKLRLRAIALVNTTAPVSDFTINLFPVLTLTGGAAVVGITVGLAVSPTITFTAPAASSFTRSDTPEFDWPAAGYYTIGIGVSATGAANSSVQIMTSLEAR